MKFRYQRWLLKTALFYLLLGLSFGILLHLTPRIETIFPGNIRTVHVHLILLGFMMQMIMGVALWMFPRKKKHPRFTSEREGSLLYFIFNAGTIIRTVSDLLQTGNDLFYLVFAGMLLQIAGIFYFILLIFRRIRVPVEH